MGQAHNKSNNCGDYKAIFIALMVKNAIGSLLPALSNRNLDPVWNTVIFFQFLCFLVKKMILCNFYEIPMFQTCSYDFYEGKSLTTKVQHPLNSKILFSISIFFFKESWLNLRCVWYSFLSSSNSSFCATPTKWSSQKQLRARSSWSHGN
jgi:uncharacterized membrane protein YbaN (DUF454 family)